MLEALPQNLNATKRFYNYSLNPMEGQQIPHNQAAQQHGQKVLIPAAEFAAKYRSKRECYNFLAVDMGVYLPAYGKQHQRVPV